MRSAWTVLAAFAFMLLAGAWARLESPSSRYLALLVGDTLPKLREPANAAQFRQGMNDAEWSLVWTPIADGEEWNRRAAAEATTAAPEEQRAAPVVPSGSVGRSPERNGYSDAAAAAIRWTQGSRAAAFRSLADAASAPGFETGATANALRPRAIAARLGAGPLAAAMAGRAAAEPEAGSIYRALIDMARGSAVEDRLRIVKVGARLRRQAATLEGALAGATLVAQTASIEPTLADSLRRAGRAKDADWVDRELSIAVMWRARIAAFGGVNPVWGWGWLACGLGWFHLMGLWMSALVTMILGLFAYMFGLGVARRLPSAPASLAVALALTAAFYLWNGATRFAAPAIAADLAAVPIDPARLIPAVWAAPAAVVMAVVFASLLPFPAVRPAPRWAARFMALLRDTGFFATGLLLFLFITTSWRIGSIERLTADRVLHGLEAGEPRIVHLRPPNAR